MMLPNATCDQLLTTPEGVAALLAHNASGAAHLAYDYELALNMGDVNDDYWSDAHQQVCEGREVIEYSLEWFSPIQRAEVLGCLLKYALGLRAAWTNSTDVPEIGKPSRDDHGNPGDLHASGLTTPLVGSVTDLANCGCAHNDDDPVLHAIHNIHKTLDEICGDLLAATGSRETADAAINAVDRKHTHQEPPVDWIPSPDSPDGLEPPF